MQRKWISSLLAVVLTLTALVALPAPRASAATTYTWNNTGSSAWTTASNWTPTRTTPATDDILVIDGTVTAAPTLTSVPAQTIGQLTITNNASVIFQAGGANTLTIGGGTGVDFQIDSGSSLTVNNSLALTILLSTGATGSVSGSMTVAGAAHKLLAADASAVTFQSGSSFTTGTFF